MAKKDDFKCPDCGSPIYAWADLDATLKLQVSSTGKLSKQTIQNNLQSDGRCGVECTECDWEMHGHDIPDGSPLEGLAQAALDAQERIDFLTEKRVRTE